MRKGPSTSPLRRSGRHRRPPRWYVVAAVAGLAAFLVVFQPWRSVGDRARVAAEGLRAGPVYVAPGAPGLVDSGHARNVVGDRAIVVAVFDDTPITGYADEERPRQALCDDLASLVPTNLVIVFATDSDGEYGSSYCTGPSFPAPTLTDDSAEDFAYSVLVAAELSWQYRVTGTDLTPEIEEYVLTFDAEAAEAYGEIPRRGPVDSAPELGRLVLACLGMVAATVAVFLLLRQAALALRGRTKTARELARRRAAIDARLSRLADRILHPTGEPDAETARNYVLTLRDFRDARDSERLDAVESRLATLERAVSERTPL